MLGRFYFSYHLITWQKLVLNNPHYFFIGEIFSGRQFETRYLIAAQVGLTWYFFIFVFLFLWNFIFFVLDLHNQVQEYYLFSTGISYHWGCLYPCPHSTQIYQREAEARNEISYTSSVNSGKWLNPLDPNISMPILHTDLYSFPKLKTRRIIIVSIKSLTPNQSPGN